jgi:hypothetical protein
VSALADGRGYSLIPAQGTANLANVNPPLTVLGGSDGAGQMTHFVKQDGLNVFRLREFFRSALYCRV